ncbi:hypothetical protein ACFW1P_13575 [Paenibacillus sp. NPDC058910]
MISAVLYFLTHHPIWSFLIILFFSFAMGILLSIWRNAILIPPKGEVFVAKYVPGFEGNILIMSDKSDYGKKWVLNKDLKPVAKAEAQLATSPTNPTFISEYRLALQAFIEKHRDGPDPDLIRSV